MYQVNCQEVRHAFQKLKKRTCNRFNRTWKRRVLKRGEIKKITPRNAQYYLTSYTMDNTNVHL